MQSRSSEEKTESDHLLVLFMKRNRDEQSSITAPAMNLTIIEVSSSLEAAITLPEGTEGDTVQALQEACAAEFSLPVAQCGLTFAGDRVDPSLPLSAQIPDGATLHLSRKRFHLRCVSCHYVSVSA